MSSSSDRGIIGDDVHVSLSRKVEVGRAGDTLTRSLGVSVDVYNTRSTLFISDSVSAPFRTAQFNKLVIERAFVNDMPAGYTNQERTEEKRRNTPNPARDPDKSAKIDDMSTIELPRISSLTLSQRSTALRPK